MLVSQESGPLKGAHDANNGTGLNKESGPLIVAHDANNGTGLNKEDGPLIVAHDANNGTGLNKEGGPDVTLSEGCLAPSYMLTGDSNNSKVITISVHCIACQLSLQR